MANKMTCEREQKDIKVWEMQFESDGDVYHATSHPFSTVYVGPDHDHPVLDLDKNMITQEEISSGRGSLKGVVSTQYFGAHGGLNGPIMKQVYSDLEFDIDENGKIDESSVEMKCTGDVLYSINEKTIELHAKKFIDLALMRGDDYSRKLKSYIDNREQFFIKVTTPNCPVFDKRGYLEDGLSTARFIIQCRWYEDYEKGISPNYLCYVATDITDERLDDILKMLNENRRVLVDGVTQGGGIRFSICNYGEYEELFSTLNTKNDADLVGYIAYLDE